jgi:hypothetical protein
MSATADRMPTSRDRILLSIEAFPFDILYRAVIGIALMPAYVYVLTLVAWRDTTAVLVFYLLAVLAALRVIPAVLRAVLPVSREVRQAWFERRKIAKTYDSFQWRKLLGLGLGWLVWLGMKHSVRSDALTLACFFTAAGFAGQIVWLRLSKTQLAEVSA